jgi:hypothetical protein
MMVLMARLTEESQLKNFSLLPILSSFFILTLHGLATHENADDTDKKH